MIKIKREVLKVVEHTAKREVQKNARIWPPLCGGLLHQPMRPHHKCK